MRSKLKEIVVTPSRAFQAPLEGCDLSHLYRPVMSDAGTSVVEKLQSLTLQYHLVELECFIEAGGRVTVTRLDSHPSEPPSFIINIHKCICFKENKLLKTMPRLGLLKGSWCGKKARFVLRFQITAQSDLLDLSLSPPKMCLHYLGLKKVSSNQRTVFPMCKVGLASPIQTTGPTWFHSIYPSFRKQRSLHPVPSLHGK